MAPVCVFCLEVELGLIFLGRAASRQWNLFRCPDRDACRRRAQAQERRRGGEQ